jgi:hypothetical protein
VIDAAAKKRKPGRPPKLASGISSRGAGPLLGRKDTKRKKRKLNNKRKPKSNWWHPPLPTDVSSLKYHTENISRRKNNVFEGCG